MRRFLFLALILALILAAGIASAQYSAYDGGLGRTSVQKTGAQNMEGDLRVTNNVIAAEFYGGGANLTGVKASLAVEYDDDTLLVTGFDGDANLSDVGVGTYVWSWIEQYWYQNTLADPGWPVPGGITYTDGTNSSFVYYEEVGYHLWTNAHAQPWSNEWVYVPISLATNRLVVIGLAGDEESGNGTYYWHGELSRWTNSTEWLIAWNDLAWALFSNAEPALVTYYTNTTGDFAQGPWVGTWAADGGATPEPTVTLAVTGFPVVARDYALGYDIQSPWFRDIDADGHSLSNVNNLVATGRVNLAGVVMDDDATYTATVAKAGSALQAEVNYSADDVLPRVFLSPGADTNYLYVINGITTGTVAIVWPAGE